MNQIYRRIICLLLCVLILPIIPVSAEGEISAVSVTVPAPVAGEMPKNQAIAGDSSYTVSSVQWSAGDAFIAGQTYQVEVTLQAAEGCTFSETVSGTVNGGTGVIRLISETELKLSASFTLENPTISHVSVTGLTVPVEGEAPDYTVTPGDGTYRVREVTWTTSDGQSAGSVFQKNREYKVSIALTAEEGVFFASAVTGTIDGSNAQCRVEGQDCAVLEMIYSVNTAITQVSVTGLTVPEKDAHPDFTADVPAGAPYTVEQVAWRGWNTAEGADSYVEMGAGDTFLPGHSYQVAILLKANSSASFRVDGQGVPQVSCTVNGEQAYSGTAGKEPSRYILTGFVFTVQGEKTPIDRVDIINLTEPSIGKKPVAKAEVPEDALYTVEQVVWKRWNQSAPVPMGSRETFELDSTYQVTVILKAKEEAAFTLDRAGNPQVKATVNEKLANPPTSVENLEASQYISVSYYFTTAWELITEVSVLELEEPVKGKLPDYKVEVPSYAAYTIEDVVWQWRDPQTPGGRYNKMTFSDAFATDKEYQICVILRAGDGAEFATGVTGQPQVTVKFNREAAKPAVSVEEEDPAKCIQVTFEFLLESNLKTVDRVAVEEIEVPTAGSQPDMEASVSFVAKYTVSSVTWERLSDGKKLNKNDTFRAGESYRVTVLLKAKEDAVFAVDASGRIQVTGTLNDKAAKISSVSGRDAKEYLSVSCEFAIYTVIEGDGAQWTPQKGNLRFRFSGNPNNLVAIRVDGAQVKDDFYTVSEGSVVIELSSRYLAALQDGNHLLTAEFTDGVATTDFEVYHDGSTPHVREQTNSFVWVLIVVLIVVLLCGAVVLSVFLRKKGWL